MNRSLSVVVPLFNEENSLPALVEAIFTTCAALEAIDVTLWLINDGSSDQSQNVIEQLAAQYPFIRAVELSKNFGKEAALSAGLDLADGDAVLFMDSDMQHPPHYIPAFVERWLDGADVVVGVRRLTESKSMWRRAFGAIYTFLAQRLSSDPAKPGETDFCLLDRRVVLAARQLRERERIFRGLIRWLGFRRVELSFDAATRFGGTPTYTFAKLVTLAFRSLTTQSQTPLRAVLYLGMLACMASCGGLLWMFFAEKLVSPVWHYTALAKALVFTIGLVGIVQVSLGIIGLYIAHTHQESLKRPLYIVRTMHRQDTP